jgi:uncharacterized OB-fold protein/acyl dehydratase
MSLLDELRSFCSDAYVMERHGLDAVNEAMIRHWCEAMGDTNPIYTDPVFAADSSQGGIVAPPQMLGAWVMRPMNWPPPDPRDGRRALIATLDEAGYTGIVATDTEQTYVRYLRPGDRIRARIGVEEVSGPKDTALGEGYFFTTRSEYLDQRDEVVGVERFRMLKFKPKARASGERPRPSSNADTAFFWEGLRSGKLLIQRCAACGTLRHPPQPMCASCRSLDWDTLESVGAGEVYSFTVHHHPPMPGFQMPYIVALIALDEGVRLLANVVEVAPDDVKIGMRVRARIERIADDLSLPMFVPES